jgi:hypothetical protein
MKNLFALALILGSITSHASQNCTKLEVENALSEYSRQEQGMEVMIGGLVYKLPFESFSTKYAMKSHPEMPFVGRVVKYKFKGNAKKSGQNAYVIGGNLKYSKESLTVAGRIYQSVIPEQVSGTVYMDEACSMVIKAESAQFSGMPVLF